LRGGNQTKKNRGGTSRKGGIETFGTGEEQYFRGEGKSSSNQREKEGGKTKKTSGENFLFLTTQSQSS